MHVFWFENKKQAERDRTIYEETGHVRSKNEKQAEQGSTVMKRPDTSVPKTRSKQNEITQLLFFGYETSSCKRRYLQEP